jgi:hypothetical protein
MMSRQSVKRFCEKIRQQANVHPFFKGKAL